MSTKESHESNNDYEHDSEKFSDKKRPYYFQLDVLKAIAIALVVMDHSLTWEIKGSIGSLFWERLSIPFFLIVMGVNMGNSFNYRGFTSLRELYSEEYFKRKVVRYIFPFLILYMGSILLGLYFGHLDSSEYLLLGYLPFWGPGNWFIPLLMGSILVFPLIYWAYRKQPILTMILCFFSEIILQFIMYLWFPSPSDSALDAFIVTAIRVNVLFFLPAVALGLWFSEGYNPFSKRNWFVWIYAVISIIFMVDYSTHYLQNMSSVIGEIFLLIDTIIRGDYTLLFYGYAAILVLFGMNILPQSANGRTQLFIQKVGKASYHILLFQIFWMSIIYWNTSHESIYNHEIPQFATLFGWSTPLFYIPFYLINLGISIAGGLLWYEVENRANSYGKPL